MIFNQPPAINTYRKKSICNFKNQFITLRFHCIGALLNKLNYLDFLIKYKLLVLLQFWFLKLESLVVTCDRRTKTEIMQRKFRIFITNSGNQIIEQLKNINKNGLESSTH